ncbi:hypothetical protein GCAAIG_01755 [Candidatus Electronema halotolerans]
MSKSDCKAVRIANASTKKVLSKGQKRFNSLIKRLETKRKLLQRWQETVPVYRQRVLTEYDALYDEYNEQRADLVRLFDAAYPKKMFTKTDKRKLKHLIRSITEELISYDVEGMKDIYNKYSEVDFDSIDKETDEQVGQMMKAMFEEMMGVEIDDDVDVSSPEKFQAALQEKLAEQEEQERLAEEKRRKRKKSARQLAKEARIEQEEQNISKSIQEVYRKLAASLHPDLETDLEEKERKTKLMQQVNVAYKEKNLLRLLELQLELEHIDQEHLNGLAEEKIQYFNKILQNQLKELEEEIHLVEYQAKTVSGCMPFAPLKPEQLLKKLDDDIEDVKDDIDLIKIDIEEFRTNTKLKEFLKTYKIPKPQDDVFDLNNLLMEGMF